MTTQEYSSTAISSVSSTSQEPLKINSITTVPITRESSSDLSLGEPYEKTNTGDDYTVGPIGNSSEAFVILNKSGENDSPNNGIAANMP